jgi:hypothetical protein
VIKSESPVSPDFLLLQDVDALGMEALRTEALGLEALGVEVLGADALGVEKPDVYAAGTFTLGRKSRSPMADFRSSDQATCSMIWWIVVVWNLSALVFGFLVSMLMYS